MACEGFPANSFRASVLNAGDRPSPVIGSKKTRRDEAHDGLSAVGVPRSETRRGNHRGGDRLPLGRPNVLVRKGRRTHEVALVNLSGGAAIIAADLKARLWDKLTLVLGSHGEIECAVRWVRDNRFGLEFAHETRIDSDAFTRDETLRNAIENNFNDDKADSEPVPAATATATAVKEVDGEARYAKRHPLIWSGMVHLLQETIVVRIRNISATGAMVQSVATLDQDSEVVLDLGNAGTHPAKVCWSQGDQAGIAFAEEFDVRLLASCKPELASRRWSKPEYLRDENVDTSPWASQWGRLSLKELRRTLSR